MSKPYYSKNRLFGVWLSQELSEWFDDYLQKNSIGQNRAERFKFFLYRLQQLEEKNIVSLTTPKPQQEQIDWRVKSVKETRDICIRRTLPNQLKEWKELSQAEKARECEMCKIRYGKEHYQACREVRREYEEANR